MACICFQNEKFELTETKYGQNVAIPRKLA